MYKVQIFILLMDKEQQTKRFREVFEDLKLKRKLTYEKLGRVFHKGKSFISEMVNGRVTPNEEVVKHLADTYGVNPGYIYLGETEMYINGTFDINQYLVSKLTKNEATLDVLLEFLTEIFEKDESKRGELIKRLNDRVQAKVSSIPGKKDKAEAVQEPD